MVQCRGCVSGVNPRGVALRRASRGCAPVRGSLNGVGTHVHLYLFLFENILRLLFIRCVHTTPITLNSRLSSHLRQCRMHAETRISTKAKAVGPKHNRVTYHIQNHNPLKIVNQKGLLLNFLWARLQTKTNLKHFVSEICCLELAN